jgi:CheY-like chemotaxis protein
LLDLGYVVIEAESGAEAIQILEQTPGIALLLTDVVMPGDVDGRMLARFAREHGDVQRVLLMSAYANDPSCNADQPLLHKPFTRAQLVALLEAVPR